jgi:hypothetical protein
MRRIELLKDLGTQQIAALPKVVPPNCNMNANLPQKIQANSTIRATHTSRLGFPFEDA